MEATVNNEAQQNKTQFKSLIGNSQSMKKVQQEISQVANSTANVLILGDSGTGKEVVARNIHFLSSRRNKNFVPINCGAIPPDLLESELFGHEKGAFTGAITSRQGRFSMAEGGTLFLDEIGEMPMAMQVKLLRVLEERVFERVGGAQTIQADVRIIAATNRNLEDMVKKGDFREDLFFRLDVFPIKIPALRNRINDLPLLIKELISRLEHSNQNSVRFTKNAVIAMSKYDWPGNIRELANLIERMSIKHPNGLVNENNLPARITANISLENKGIELPYLDNPDLDNAYLGNPYLNNSRLQSDDGTEHNKLSSIINTPQVHFPVEDFDLKTYISSIEVKIIEEALNKSDGIIAHAAKSLGLRRTTLAEKMRKYNLGKSTEYANCHAC